MSKLKACLETEDFWLDGTRLMLRRRETEILCALAAAKGATVSWRRLYSLMDLNEHITDDRHLVYNNIHRLRKIIGYDSVICRAGVGWLLNMELELVTAKEAFG